MTPRIVHQSQSMQHVLALAERYATSPATVLIEGESGTGKELLARFLHDHSNRPQRPYVRVNCAALNENLVDSALFGHERGAFTGADTRQQGCFEVADDGTLFLDEVGELPLHVQAKLLRVLEEGEFQRVGSFDVLPVRARVITATNRNLLNEVAHGRFREDLYYRLDVLRLSIPPLRERPEDIPLLVNNFLDDGRSEGAHNVQSVSGNLLQHLQTMPWPGNARQLRNLIYRECLQIRSEVLESICNSPGDSREGTPLPPDFYQLSLKDIERHVILSRLEHFAGNRTQAAESLQVTTRTLRNKLALYNVHSTSLAGSVFTSEKESTQPSEIVFSVRTQRPAVLSHAEQNDRKAA